VHFEEWMDVVVHAFEVAGVGILGVGFLVALLGAARALSRGERRTAYEQARQNVGRAILLGLEVLIIADIVETITIDPTLESAAALGLIVLVRTFLSFSLEVELDGALPWRKERAAERGRASDGSSTGDEAAAATTPSG
jgi:uncharacterized membrane protein